MGTFQICTKINTFPWKPLPRKLIDACLHLSQKLLHAFEISIAIVTYCGQIIVMVTCFIAMLTGPILDDFCSCWLLT